MPLQLCGVRRVSKSSVTVSRTQNPPVHTRPALAGGQQYVQWSYTIRTIPSSCPRAAQPDREGNLCNIARADQWEEAEQRRHFHTCNLCAMSLSAALRPARLAIASASRAAAVVRSKHSLPDLPYDYNALEPVISAEIMTLHHSKHHQTYVNNLNDAEEKSAEALATGNVSAAVALQPALRFNGGGHINHAIFWTNLAPEGQGGEPSDELKKAITDVFGSMEQFQSKMSAQTAAVQGSGWGWLGYNKNSKRVEIATCPNQDPLEASTGLVPLFGIDVWEHAYYLQYKNVRPDYLKAIWRIVNWNNVNERFEAAKQ
eukprot:m.232419 g.232419  ORF g.232419 m.232419 type:complete len:315 (+) comp10875_c0_seq68:911-1855(+)